jgi:hypothetical protein
MPRPLAKTPWPELTTQVQRMLRWLNVCTLIATADLCRVVWPQPIQEHKQVESLQRWADAELIRPLDDGSGYQLGAAGAARLREAGRPVYGVTQELSARVRPGLLLASRFAIGLWRDLQPEAAVGGLTWLARPFSGEGVRADAVGTILYTHDRRPCPRVADDLLCDDLPPHQLRGMQELMRLIVEIDSGTETLTQLRERARAWRSAIREMSISENTGVLVLWITTGGWERAGTIWQAWVEEARTPGWFTTIAALQQTDGSLRPWQSARIDMSAQRQSVWRDEHGRPRSLNPWELEEPRWRYAAAGPPTSANLAEAIHSWDGPAG